MTSPELGAVHDALAAALRGALSGHYDVERELGRGGMATVFLARDLRHARAVAVKVMVRDVVAPGGTERFLHEIRTAARLTHPHILGVHDSGESDGLLYYVMPYVEGETLRARLRRDGALPLSDAVRLIRELADALAYAHARGVVHRDLKPENVLLSGGHAVIADFGIAKALSAATQDGSAPTPGVTGTGVSVGTPAYMAPEQAIGDRNTDHRADLYALGVVAYEVLAGAHPFGARSPQALVAAHLTESPAPLGEQRSDMSRALDALVMQLLAKEPAARPQSAEVVLRALDASVTSPVRLPPRLWRRRAFVVIAGFLIAGAVGYAAWRWNSSSEGKAGQGNGIRTVAVLPFENTGPDQNDEYFSSGLTDELAHALTQLPGVRIAGRTSSYAFKGKAVAAQEIGRALDVAAIVGGAVRRAGDRLRVTTQLVSTRDGKVLWDSVYESRSRDVFAMQDEFTRAIAAALARSLGDRSALAQRIDVGRGTTNEAAYELFLKGQFFYLARGEANVTRSVDYFRQAIALDPQFARAYAGLATSYHVLRTYVFDPTDSLPPLARSNAQRAVALDSTVADAHVAMGLVLNGDLRFPEAESHYRRAIALEPTNGGAHLGYGFERLATSHTEDAIREFREAVRLDPLVKSARSALSLSLVFARQFPEAIAESRRLLTVDSTFALTFIPLSLAQAMSGQADSAVQTLEQSERYNRTVPHRRKLLLFAYAAAGRWTDVERLRAELRQPGGDLSGGTDVAFAEFLLGDRESLVRVLSTAAGQRRWNGAGFLGCNPLLDPLWSDERFTTAMRALDVEPCKLAGPWPIPRRR
jgi:serine/threonine-protein kinase